MNMKTLSVSPADEDESIFTVMSSLLKPASRGGQITLKSNGDEALGDEFLLKSNGDEALKNVFP
jgi:hypothetical protein